jgi:hypothetical protein
MPHRADEQDRFWPKGDDVRQGTSSIPDPGQDEK